MATPLNAIQSKMKELGFDTEVKSGLDFNKPQLPIENFGSDINTPTTGGPAANTPALSSYVDVTPYIKTIQLPGNPDSPKYEVVDPNDFTKIYQKAIQNYVAKTGDTTGAEAKVYPLIKQWDLNNPDNKIKSDILTQKTELEREGTGALQGVEGLLQSWFNVPGAQTYDPQTGKPIKNPKSAVGASVLGSLKKAIAGNSDLAKLTNTPGITPIASFLGLGPVDPMTTAYEQRKGTFTQESQKTSGQIAGSNPRFSQFLSKFNNESLMDINHEPEVNREKIRQLNRELAGTYGMSIPAIELAKAGISKQETIDDVGAKMTDDQYLKFFGEPKGAPQKTKTSSSVSTPTPTLPSVPAPLTIKGANGHTYKLSGGQ